MNVAPWICVIGKILSTFENYHFGKDKLLQDFYYCNIDQEICCSKVVNLLQYIVFIENKELLVGCIWSFKLWDIYVIN